MPNSFDEETSFGKQTPLTARRLLAHYGGLPNPTTTLGIVENWFELLDSRYDSVNDQPGGINGCRC